MMLIFAIFLALRVSTSTSDQWFLPPEVSYIQKDIEQLLQLDLVLSSSSRSSIGLALDTLSWKPTPPHPFSPHNVSQDCHKSLINMTDSLLAGESWPMSLVDASGKPGAGLLQGNIFWTGRFSECSDISQIQTSFFLIEIELFVNKEGNITQVTFKEGLCSPSSCSANDVKSIFENIVDSNNTAVNITIGNVVMVDTNKGSELLKDMNDISKVCTIILLGGFVLIVTTIDLFYKKERQENNNIEDRDVDNEIQEQLQQTLIESDIVSYLSEDHNDNNVENLGSNDIYINIEDAPKVATGTYESFNLHKVASVDSDLDSVSKNHENTTISKEEGLAGNDETDAEGLQSFKKKDTESKIAGNKIDIENTEDDIIDLKETHENIICDQTFEDEDKEQNMDESLIPNPQKEEISKESIIQNNTVTTDTQEEEISMENLIQNDTVVQEEEMSNESLIQNKTTGTDVHEEEISNKSLIQNETNGTDTNESKLKEDELISKKVTQQCNGGNRKLSEKETQSTTFRNPLKYSSKFKMLVNKYESLDEETYKDQCKKDDTVRTISRESEDTELFSENTEHDENTKQKSDHNLVEQNTDTFTRSSAVGCSDEESCIRKAEDCLQVKGGKEDFTTEVDIEHSDVRKSSAGNCIEEENSIDTQDTELVSERLEQKYTEHDENMNQESESGLIVHNGDMLTNKSSVDNSEEKSCIITSENSSKIESETKNITVEVEIEHSNGTSSKKHHDSSNQRLKELKLSLKSGLSLNDINVDQIDYAGPFGTPPSTPQPQFLHPPTWTHRQDGLSEEYVRHLYSNKDAIDKLIIETHDVPDAKIEVCPEKKPFSIKAHFLAFSALRNSRSLFNTDASQDINYIHGMRFLSMAWVILGHTFLLAIPTIDNPLEALKYTKDFAFQFVNNATFSVDTFFFISGLLVTMIFLDKKDKIQSFGPLFWVKYVFHRYIRLAPAYMGVVLLFQPLLYYTCSGPFCPAKLDTNCRDYWWRNLLNIQNLFAHSEMCAPWTWYIAVDFQLYLLTPLFLVPLLLIPPLAWVIWTGLLFTSLLTTYYLATENSLPISYLPTSADFSQFDLRFDTIYDKPWTRAGPYLIGIIIGYALHLLKSGNLPVPKIFIMKKLSTRILNATGWFLFTGLGFFVVFGLYHCSTSPSYASAYLAMSRTAWAISLGFMALSCSAGWGGRVQSLLSLPCLRPLSRLTYSAYLVHPLILALFYNSLTTPLYASIPLFLFLFSGTLVVSYSCAYLYAMVFEAPFIKLQKLHGC